MKTRIRNQSNRKLKYTVNNDLNDSVEAFLYSTDELIYRNLVKFNYNFTLKSLQIKNNVPYNRKLKITRKSYDFFCITFFWIYY